MCVCVCDCKRERKRESGYACSWGVGGWGDVCVPNHVYVQYVC